jgi:Na+/proline symporter
MALVMAGTDIRSLYTTFLEIIGLLGGTLSGLFVLGIFSRRANGRGAVVGAVISAVIVFSVRAIQPLNVFAYAPLGLISGVIFGWLASLVLPVPARSLDGLTLHTLKKTP